MAWRVGVDIGGTFTDVALVDEATGEIGVAKVPTTPRNLAEGVLAGAAALPCDRYGVEAVEGRAAGARHHGRHQRHPRGQAARAPRSSPRAASATCWSCGAPPAADLYDLFQDAPATLVPRRHRYRDHRAHRRRRGRWSRRWRIGEIDALIATLRARAGRGASPSALLFSFLNPDHERQLGARLRAALPGAPDLSLLRGAAGDQGVRAHQHDGGVRLRRADPCLLPGAAGGARRAAWACRRYTSWAPTAASSRPREAVAHAGDGGGVGPGGRRRCGGAGGAADRPAQPSLVRHGRHHGQGQPDPRRPVRDHARVRGRRRLEPQPLDARHRPPDPRVRSSTWRRSRPAAARSRGSIAPASLRVGPKSAGADPGPVCYGRGGTEPTVTDCNLLLGYLDKGSLLGGELPIDHAAAEAAIARAI